MLSSNNRFVSGARSSLVHIRRLMFSRIISCCRKGTIVLVSNVSIVSRVLNNLKKRFEMV